MRQRFPPPLNLSVAKAIATAIRSIEAGPKQLIGELLSERSYIVCFVNAHAINVACENEEYLSALMRADLLLRDGIGMQIFMSAIGQRAGVNMNGTDFIPQILRASKSKSIALYGSSAEVSAAAAAVLKKAGSAQVTYCDGFQSVEYYCQRIRVEQPRVVVLGMGMPKQELVADAIRNEFSAPTLVICGGAIIDFIADRFARAPLLMRRMGMEWAFRLWLEPRRLWRRYLAGNTVFLARASVAFLYYRFIYRHVTDSG